MLCVFSGVKLGCWEQVVGSLSGSVASAAQCFSSLYPSAVSGGAAQERPAQPPSSAPRWAAAGCFFIVFITQSARFNGVFLGRTDEQQQRSSSRERNRVTISISVAPPMPTFPSPHTIRRQQRSRLARAVKINICEAIYDMNHQSGGKYWD